DGRQDLAVANYITHNVSILLRSSCTGGTPSPTATATATVTASPTATVTATPSPTATASPPPLIVTTTADSGAGSLRDTIAAANDSNTIQFDPALNGQTITLTSGELMIDKSITISGPGSNLLTVSRSSTAASFRIFHVTPNHTVIIGGVTISGGNGAPNGSGVLNDHATLTLESCTVQNNSN